MNVNLYLLIKVLDSKLNVYFLTKQYSQHYSRLIIHTIFGAYCTKDIATQTDRLLTELNIPPNWIFAKNAEKDLGYEIINGQLYVFKMILVPKDFIENEKNLCKIDELYEIYDSLGKDSVNNPEAKIILRKMHTAIASFSH